MNNRQISIAIACVAAMALIPDSALAITAPVAGDSGYNIWNSVQLIKASGVGKTIVLIAVTFGFFELRTHPLAGVGMWGITAGAWYAEDLLGYLGMLI